MDFYLAQILRMQILTSLIKNLNTLKLLSVPLQNKIPTIVTIDVANCVCDEYRRVSIFDDAESAP